MLKRLVVQARNKPKHKRDKYALTIALGFTSIVAMVWLYHAPGRVLKVVDEIGDGEAPMAEFFSQVSGQMATAKESLPDKDVSSSASSSDRGWTTLEEYMSRTQRGASTTSSTTDIGISATTTVVTSTIATSTEPRPVRIITTSTASSSASTTPQLP